MKKTFLLIALILAGGLAFAGCTEQTPPPAKALIIRDCLNQKQAVIYWANWCTHCKDMKQDMKQAFFEVKNIDCAANDANALECQKAGIDGFPTTILKDGKKIVGYPTLPTTEERLTWLEKQAC